VLILRDEQPNDSHRNGSPCHAVAGQAVVMRHTFAHVVSAVPLSKVPGTDNKKRKTKNMVSCYFNEARIECSVRQEGEGLNFIPCRSTFSRKAGSCIRTK
jgi:hypothetical protein